MKPETIKKVREDFYHGLLTQYRETDPYGFRNRIEYGFDSALGFFYREYDNAGNRVIFYSTRLFGDSRLKIVSALEQTFCPRGHLICIARGIDPLLCGKE